MDIKVNHLPVLTWNHLKLNRASLHLDETNLLSATSYRKPVELPDGIALEENIGFEALQERFAALSVCNPKEAVVAGKFPIYNSQSFATGMGGEVDELMKKAGAAAEIYTIESDFRSEEPIVLHYEYPAGSSELGRVFLHAKAGSESTFLLYYSSVRQDGGNSDAAKTAVGMQTYLYLEEGAKVHLHVVQMLDKNAVFFHDIGGAGMKDSELILNKLDLGALTVYEGLNEMQVGDNSIFSSDFGYIGTAESKLDINYNDVFWGKKAEGSMYFKEALLDDAAKTFRGTVDFRQDSIGSVGDEQEDIILLGDNIINKTIPLILCEEEDVEGRHAATIGSLSEDMLFYMQTRGIDKQKAEELMVTANMKSISQKIPSEKIQKDVAHYICRVFS